MTTNNNPLPSFIARNLRDLTPAAFPAVLTAALLSAPLSHLSNLNTWIVDYSATLIGAHSRTLILSAISAAIITTGERADACREGTRTHTRHLDRMAAIDTLGESLLVALDKARAA